MSIQDEMYSLGEPPIEVMDTPLWSGTFDFYGFVSRKVSIEVLRVQAIELARRYYRHYRYYQVGPSHRDFSFRREHEGR